jgi:hypothetical protein
MMNRRLLITSIPVLAAMFAPGFLTAASADVVSMDEFKVTRNGTTIFDDTFSAGLTLAGGTGNVFSSGKDFSGSATQANYFVGGTVTETGNKAILDTALGVHEALPQPPFFSSLRLNVAVLLTGLPISPFSLTPSDTFTATGVFDLTVPATSGGAFQAEFTGGSDTIAMQVKNCTPSTSGCGGGTGKFVQLQNASFPNTNETIAQVPLVTSNEEILLEMSHPIAGSDRVFGSYAYINGGVEGSLHEIGFFDNLFQHSDFTQAAFSQFAPTPEPASLALLAASIPSVLGLGWLRRRKAARSKTETGA